MFPLDTGLAFAIIKERDAIKKTEEEIRKLKTIKFDLSSSLPFKLQKELVKERKDGKFNRKICFKVYMSHIIQARLTIKKVLNHINQKILQ